MHLMLQLNLNHCTKRKTLKSFYITQAINFKGVLFHINNAILTYIDIRRYAGSLQSLLHSGSCLNVHISRYYEIVQAYTSDTF